MLQLLAKNNVSPQGKSKGLNKGRRCFSGANPGIHNSGFPVSQDYKCILSPLKRPIKTKIILLHGL